MGDRASVCVKGNESEVYLYTHWGGYRIHESVANALAKRERWNDAAYLTRIIFDSMTKLEGGTTGYGISSFHCDGQLLIVNTDDSTVTSELEGQFMFDEFVMKFSTNKS